MGNIHKRLCVVYGSCAVIGAPLDAGFRELRLQEVEKMTKRDSCSEEMAT